MSLAAVRRNVARIGRRRTLVMVDTATSSLSNVVVTVMVAGVLDPKGFGAFSVAMVTYPLAIGVVRAVVGEPWLSAHSTDDPAGRRRALADLVPASLVLSLACSVVILGAAAVNGGASTAPLVALAIVFPYLGVQDALRHVAIIDRPQVALVSDLAWLVIVVGFVIEAPSGASPEWFVVAWGVGGAVGLLLALVALQVPLRRGRAWDWLTKHRTLSAAYFGEYLTARAGGQVVLLALGAIAGLAALGAVRAAQVFYGPLNVLHGGLYLVLVPDGARRRDRPRSLTRLMAAATAIVSGTAGLWTVAGLVLPDRFGRALFGQTWVDAQELILPMGLAMVAGGLATGAFAGLRSLAAARHSLRARLYSLPPQLVFTVVGAAAGSAIGYTIGFAAANVAVGVIWWAVFLGALGRSVGGRLPDPGSPADQEGAVLVDQAR